MNTWETSMHAIRKSSAAVLFVAVAWAAGSAKAVEFTVPVEATGIMPQVKSIRVTCTAIAFNGTTRGSGSAFLALQAGAVNQSVAIKVDVDQPKGLPAASAYSCGVDRIFDIDVTQLKPVPKGYLAPVEGMSEGAPVKDMHLQYNSVAKVGGKL